MKKIFIRLITTSKIYCYKTGLKLKPQDEVLVENDQIIEDGIVVEKPKNLSEIEDGKGKIIREITAEDRQLRHQLKRKARQLIREAQKKVIRHGLKMQILDVDLSYDEKKLTFYFTADTRIDFRSLVTDLVKSYSKLIRLQQVGSRDEAKYFGGIGRCGREVCCASFLNNLESITLEMAEIQELATAGSAKLSGCCGKLMCCLAFEADLYKDLKKKMPKIGSYFETLEGEGKVIAHNVLESKVILQTKEGKKIEVLV